MTDFHRQLADRLEKARKNAAELARQLERLQREHAAAEEDVSTWEQALLAEQRASGGLSAAAADVVERPLRGLTLGDAVRRVLQQTGKPLHAKDILRALRTQGYQITSANPIPVIVTTLTRRRDFKRVAPNTFDLTEDSEEAGS